MEKVLKWISRRRDTSYFNLAKCSSSSFLLLFIFNPVVHPLLLPFTLSFVLYKKHVLIH